MSLRTRWMIGASAALGVAGVALALDGPPRTGLVLIDVGQAIVALLAARLLRAWWAETGERGWRSLALAGRLTAPAMLATALARLVSADPAVVAGARLLLLPGMVMAVVGAVRLATADGTARRSHVVVESGLLASASALVAWQIVGRPSLALGERAAVAGLALACFVTAATMTAAWLHRGGLRLAALAGAVVCAAWAEVSVLVAHVHGHENDHMIHALASAGAAALTLAIATAEGWFTRPRSRGLRPGVRLAAVLSPVVAASAVTPIALVRGTTGDAVTVVLAALTLVGLLLNVFAYHLENRALADHLHARMADLTLARDRTRALLDGLVEAVIVIGPDGRVTDVNDPFVALTGWSAAEMAGRHGLDVAAPQDRALALAELDAMRAAPSSAGTMEMQILRRDGTVVWVEAGARNLLDEPSVGGIVVTLRDISERRLAAQQLLDAQELFRTAFEGAPIGMVLATPDGRMLEVNGAFARMLGHVPADLEGRSIDTVVALDARAAGPGRTQIELLRERFAWPGLWSQELVLRDVDGRRVVTTTSGRRLANAPGGPLVICQIQDVTAARNAADQLAWSVAHDALTGLPNRTEFVRAVATAVDRRQADAAVGVVYVDIDRFKLVNDSLGHAAGDELLQVVARRLGAVVRSGDLVARIGGDELTVMVTAASEDAVVAVAERIREAVAEPVLLADGDIYVTASIGVAVADASSCGPAGSGPNGSADDLLRDADAALHRAKERGRNRVERFDEDTRHRVVATLQTANDLHRALERGELVVHYQPVVSLADHAIVGVEALVRWNHRERGMVSPAEFIPMAEDTGLIVPVGEHVLDLAAGDLARWQAMPGWAGLKVNVNLSPRQMAAPNVVDMFERALGRHGVDPDGLWVEITETALMADVRVATVILRAMRAMGLHIAVDDFGTGYSSLTYLTKFPVECLKIDRSFVAGIGIDRGADAIVDAVVGLGRTMGLAVVSEGIETEAQADRLRAMGCPLGQGYLYSRPVPPAQIDALLRSGAPLAGAVASGAVPVGVR